MLNLGERVYFNLKSASPSVLWRELQVKDNLGADGFPLPPPNLMYDVIASCWQAVFMDSGQKVVDDMAAQLAQFGHPLQDFSSILDFGCGCGRLIRRAETHRRDPDGGGLQCVAHIVLSGSSFICQFYCKPAVTAVYTCAGFLLRQGIYLLKKQ